MAKATFLADKLRAGKTVITGWSLLPAPMIAELFARSGYEAVTLDLQHGMYDFNSACEALALIALAGSNRIVRLPVGDLALTGRLADMGAECLIAPMVNSKEEAQAFADAVKYPPRGQRSWSPFRAAMLSRQTSDQYLQNANDQTLAFAMIETQEAIDALDDILAVESLDGVFVGPSDLSLALTHGRRLDPNGEKTAKACADIAAKATEAGKIAGIFCLNEAKVREAVGQGYRLISHGIDTIFLDHSARAALREVEGL
ncbi:hydroxyacid aldolase [Roseibium denhamense]|uniref:4-hydroxy-2-oxoheptanedioate aldolase n=1 Tax=Roseibium denhamense TaxID=76305 RepID=A0ABY1N7R1_9HYPH|nr:aldolase/citrate lyase family protein [Roseibium denhamense]MTI06025.1 hydroxyacid aldolase [Roseibium denhamense]SMP01944.1 4-hydroxy-2-oxoheptanedioate aldolase [Roseibium denhamense]